MIGRRPAELRLSWPVDRRHIARMQLLEPRHHFCFAQQRRTLERTRQDTGSQAAPRALRHRCKTIVPGLRPNPAAPDQLRPYGCCPSAFPA